jgi:hypothetical protein
MNLQHNLPVFPPTTQVFHLLNFLVCSLRAGIFVFRDAMEGLHPTLVKLMMLDLPGWWTL